MVRYGRVVAIVVPCRPLDHHVGHRGKPMETPSVFRNTAARTRLYTRRTAEKKSALYLWNWWNDHPTQAVCEPTCRLAVTRRSEVGYLLGKFVLDTYGIW